MYETLHRTIHNDNTKPSARMGRKAYRVSLRQPGCRYFEFLATRLFLYVVFVLRKYPVVYYKSVSFISSLQELVQ